MTDMMLALRTFARVADRLSFTEAARQTHASHTTVARRIDFLEAHFGVRLLHRTTRQLALTEEGERLLDHARTILDEMEHVEADLTGHAGDAGLRGVVRVGVTTALGLHYADRLIELIDAHPALRIEFAMADWQAKLAEEGLDLALRVGETSTEGGHLYPLGSLRRVLVAAPAYMARRPAPATARDLVAHECITYGYGPHRALWEVDGLELRVSGAFRANSSEAVHRAVASGLGIGLLPLIQVRDELDAGSLARILPRAVIPALRLSAACRFPGPRIPARVRVVLDFLKATFPDRDH